MVIINIVLNILIKWAPKFWYNFGYSNVVNSFDPNDRIRNLLAVRRWAQASKIDSNDLTIKNH